MRAAVEASLVRPACEPLDQLRNAEKRRWNELLDAWRARPTAIVCCERGRRGRQCQSRDAEQGQRPAALPRRLAFLSPVLHVYPLSLVCAPRRTEPVEPSAVWAA